MKFLPRLLALLLLLSPSAAADEALRVYRETPQGELTIAIDAANPAVPAPAAGRPAVVLFFGGGWIQGGPGHLFPQARALADRGMVALRPDYRTAKRHGTTPFDSVADAVAAMRWTRAHAAELGIDPDRIAAGGGSAGGHLAIATATVGQNFDDAPEVARAESYEPNALLLLNPVFDNGPDGHAFGRVKERWQEFSPAHNLRASLPPTLTMLGGEDHLIPAATAERVHAELTKLGVPNKLILYPGLGHGFYNDKPENAGNLERTIADMDAFLVGIGWLNPAKDAAR